MQRSEVDSRSRKGTPRRASGVVHLPVEALLRTPWVVVGRPRSVCLGRSRPQTQAPEPLGRPALGHACQHAAGTPAPTTCTCRAQGMRIGGGNASRSQLHVWKRQFPSPAGRGPDAGSPPLIAEGPARFVLSGSPPLRTRTAAASLHRDRDGAARVNLARIPGCCDRQPLTKAGRHHLLLLVCHSMPTRCREISTCADPGPLPPHRTDYHVAIFGLLSGAITGSVSSY